MRNALREDASVHFLNYASTRDQLLAWKRKSTSAFQYKRAKTFYSNSSVSRGLEGETIANKRFACNQTSILAHEQFKQPNLESVSKFGTPKNDAEIPDIASTRLTQKLASQSTRSQILHKPLKSIKGWRDAFEISSPVPALSYQENPVPFFPPTIWSDHETQKVPNL